MIRSSGFTLGAYSRFEILARALLLPRSLASRRSALVDLHNSNGGGDGGVAASVLWGRLARRVGIFGEAYREKIVRPLERN